MFLPDRRTLAPSKCFTFFQNFGEKAFKIEIIQFGGVDLDFLNDTKLESFQFWRNLRFLAFSGKILSPGKFMIC